MIIATSASDGRLIGVVLVSLLLFGVLYNRLMDWLDRRKDGYTSLLVAGGVLVSLAGVAVISWQAAGLSLLAFAASGLPMIIGEAVRYVRRRDKQAAKTARTSRRIIMPKYTAGLIDDALMDLSEVLRQIETLLNSGDLTPVKLFGLLSLITIKLNRAINNLKEVPRNYKQERENSHE